MEKGILDNGEKVFIRTVTYHLVGEVVGLERYGEYDNAAPPVFVRLKDASWVADSGRFMNAIKQGTLNEVEPVGDVLVNLSSITDVFPWQHGLPTSQK